MRFKINRFSVYLSFPAIALISIIVISNSYTNYLLCFLAIIIHELGHLVFMYLFGYNPIGVNVKAFNISIIENKRYNSEFSKDIIITLAGSLFNILVSLILLFFYREFALVNLFVGLFNLLPAASLDGGQLIYLLLVKRFTPEISAKILEVITIITALPIFLIGIMVMLNSKYNFSLLFIGIYLILSLFIRDEKYL